MLTINHPTSDHYCDAADCAVCNDLCDGWGEPLGHNRCQCCGEIDPMLFMISQDLWQRVTSGRTEILLCWKCTEAQLGRSIVPVDLTNCPINRMENPAMMVAAEQDLGTPPAHEIPAPQFVEHWHDAVGA